MSQVLNGTYLRIIVGLCALNLGGWLWTIWRVTDGVAAITAMQSRAQESSTGDAPRRERAADKPLTDIGPLAQLNVSGVSAPSLCAATEAGLDDGAPVIGVTIGGQARAYAIEAFEVPAVNRREDVGAHVVNDVIGGRPVCVTHCDETHSTRVLTDNSTEADAAQPIDLRVGGWSRGLLLMLNGARYRQHASTIPLDDMAFVTTTWKEWCAEHPDTLVYTGKQCRG